MRDTFEARVAETQRFTPDHRALYLAWTVNTSPTKPQTGSNMHDRGEMIVGVANWEWPGCRRTKSIVSDAMIVSTLTTGLKT